MRILLTYGRKGVLSSITFVTCSTDVTYYVIQETHLNRHDTDALTTDFPNFQPFYSNYSNRAKGVVTLVERSDRSCCSLPVAGDALVYPPP